MVQSNASKSCLHGIWLVTVGLLMSLPLLGQTTLYGEHQTDVVDSVNGAPTSTAADSSIQIQNPGNTAMDLQEATIRRMIAYLEANLNTLGDPSVSSRDKDILISESYQKLFRDARVQIEDDLDQQRSTPTYKDVTAYLLDVDFFFRKVVFEYSILNIEGQMTQTGEESWLIQCNRSLMGIRLKGDSLRNTVERFIEVNRTADGLKIVSMYSTKYNRTQSNRQWWAELSPLWKSLLAGDAALSNELRLSDVRGYHDALLISSTDTFLLPGSQNSEYQVGPGLWYFFGDTIMLQDSTRLDLSVEAIDAFLDGLLSVRELDLSGTKVRDLYPLSALRNVRILNLSSTPVRDLTPLRSMAELEELNISGTLTEDLNVLRYSRKLRKILARNSAISADLPDFAQLEYLDLAACPLHPNWTPGPKPSLRYLDLSGTGLQSVQRFSALPQLEHLDLSFTKVSQWNSLSSSSQMRVILAAKTPLQNLGFLSAMESLEWVNIDGTAVSSLDPLKGKKKLERIYCDGTAVSDSLIRAFQAQHPGIMIIFETAYLNNWWNGLNAAWKRAFRQALGFADHPGKEELHGISALKHLDLSGADLLETLVPLNEMPALEGLNLEGTQLEDFTPIGRLKNLRELNLNHSPLVSLDMLAGLSELEVLHIENTPIEDLSPLFDLKRLSKVYMDSCNIRAHHYAEMERANPKALLIWNSAERLQWWNGLDLEWKDFLSTMLVFSGAPDKEQLERMRHLEEINLPSAGLNEIGALSYFKRLRILRLPNNRVSSLSALSAFSSLEVLDVTANPIYGLEGLESHTQLRELIADNTPIRSLDPLARSMLLEHLSVAGTEIRNLQPLILHRSLSYLNCSNTRVRNLSPLDKMSNLKELIIFNTGLNAAKVEQFRSNHPNCKITFY